VPISTPDKKGPGPKVVPRPFEKSSGRRDLNPRPLDPQSSALPSCATSRHCSPADSPAGLLTLAQNGRDPARRRRLLRPVDQPGQTRAVRSAVSLPPGALAPGAGARG
jgi:hypothetical protein